MRLMKIIDASGDSEYNLDYPKELEEARKQFNNLVPKGKHFALRMEGKQKGTKIYSFQEVEASELVILAPHLQGG